MISKIGHIALVAVLLANTAVLAVSELFVTIDGESPVSEIPAGTAFSIIADCDTGATVQLIISVISDAYGEDDDAKFPFGNVVVADGDTSWPDVFRDSEHPPNGRVVLGLPAFWANPMKIMLMAFEDDHHIVTDTINVVDGATPAITVSGMISPDGTVSPAALEGITIYMNYPLAMAFTDSLGRFEIPLPFGGFDTQIQAIDPKGYLMFPRDLLVHIPASGTDDIVIPAELPSREFRVRITDQFGDFPLWPMAIELFDSTWERFQRVGIIDSLILGARDAVPTLLSVDNGSVFGYLTPFSMNMPLTPDTSYYNVQIYKADTSIHGRLDMPDSMMGCAYSFSVRSGMFNEVIYSNVWDNSLKFPAATALGSTYSICVEEQGGRFAVPEGFIIYPECMNVSIGDSAIFQLMPYENAIAKLNGRILQISGEPLESEVEMRLQELPWGEMFTDTTVDGYFSFEVLPGRYRISSSYEMLDYEIPLLYPNYHTAYFEIALELRDSLNFNVPCYPSNDSIIIHIDELGNPPSKRLKFRAPHVVVGTMVRHCDTTSHITYLPISNAFPQPYSVYIETGDTPLPEGLYTEGPPSWNLVSGDTAFLRLKPYPNFISGALFQDPGDPTIPNFHRFSMMTVDLASGEIFDTTKVRLDRRFYQSVPDGVYRVVPVPDEEFIFKPHYRDSVLMAGEDVYIAGFTANKLSCSLFVNIEGVPPDSVPQFIFEGWGDADYPDGYYVRSEQSAGVLSFSVPVCDAEWRFFAPRIPEYEAAPPETTIVIEEFDIGITLNFNFSWVAVEETEKPYEFALYPNTPNPFNPATRIDYSIDVASEVSLEVYDITGKLVERLVEGAVSTGRHSVVWDGGKTSSGVYFAVLKRNGEAKIKRMILLK